MRKLGCFGFIIIAILAALFGAITPGQSGIAQPGTTLWAIQTAMQGGVGTRLFLLEGHTVLFAAARPDGDWVIAGIQTAQSFSRMTAGKGTVVSAKDMLDFERTLLSMPRPWQLISPEQLPAWVPVVVAEIKASVILRIAMGNLTTFFAVPLTTLENLPWVEVEFTPS